MTTVRTRRADGEQGVEKNTMNQIKRPIPNWKLFIMFCYAGGASMYNEADVAHSRIFKPHFNYIQKNET
jgi:hypothetical protein